MRCYILCGSVTYAMKAKKRLLYYGIRAHETRISGDITGESCGYAVEVNMKDLDAALTVLNREKVKYKAVYKV